MSEVPEQLMKIALSLNNEEKAETESQMEIPAAKVRASKIIQNILRADIVS